MGNEAGRQAQWHQAWLWGALLVALGVAMVGALSAVYPLGEDWRTAFYPAVQQFLSPYTIPKEKFVGFPHVLFFLPHGFLPIELGNAVNFTLHLIVLTLLIRRYRGGWQAYAMTFTSFLFIDLARTNNVDWLPALAFLLPSRWGLVLLAAKPQILGGAALIWWKRTGFDWRFLVPTLAVFALSFVVWGWWLPNVLRLGAGLTNTFWNFSPFPLGVPIGVYLLYRAYRTDDEVLAACATPFFATYFAPYSLAPLLALLACRYPRMAFYVYVSFWFFFVVEARRLVLIGAG
jgi:hypothetical protein